MATQPDTFVVTGLDFAQLSIGLCSVTPTGQTQNSLAYWLANNNGVTLGALTAIIAALPTTEPGTTGVLWLNGGILQLS